VRIFFPSPHKRVTDEPVPFNANYTSFNRLPLLSGKDFLPLERGSRLLFSFLSEIHLPPPAGVIFWPSCSTPSAFRFFFLGDGPSADCRRQLNMVLFSSPSGTGFLFTHQSDRGGFFYACGDYTQAIESAPSFSASIQPFLQITTTRPKELRLLFFFRRAIGPFDRESTLLFFARHPCTSLSPPTPRLQSALFSSKNTEFSFFPERMGAGSVLPLRSPWLDERRPSPLRELKRQSPPLTNNMYSSFSFAVTPPFPPFP